MKAAIIFPVLFLSLVLSGAEATDESSKQRISDSAVTPVIDGVVNDAEWADATVFPRFIRVAEDTPPTPDQMRLMMKFDDENLYIGFRAEMDMDPEIVRLPDDSQETVGVDSLEITLCPPDSPMWMKFVVERAGGKTDLRYKNWNIQPASGWNPEWQYKSRILPGEFLVKNIWEGEIAIPWKSLEMTPPPPGELLQVPATLVRTHGNKKFYSSPLPRQSSWTRVSSPWGLPDSHVRGMLLFARGKSVIRYEDSRNFETGRASYRATFTGPGNYVFMPRVWNIKNSQDVLFSGKTDFSGDRIDWEGGVTVKEKRHVMMYFQITDGEGISGVVSRHGNCLFIQPPFWGEGEYIPSRDVLAVSGALNMQTLPESGKIHIRLADQNGKDVASEALPTDGKREFFLEMPLEKVVAGKYTLLVRLDDRTGKALNSFSKPFEFERPDWLTHKRGIVTAPPAGFSPLKHSETADGIQVDVSRHSLVFKDSFLPEKITLSGEEFSSGAWTFQAETDSGIQEFKPVAPLKVTDGNKRGITLVYKGESKDLFLEATVRIEFDSFLWHKVKLSPKSGNVKVKELSLAAPMKPEKLRYMASSDASSPLDVPFYYALISKARTDRVLPKPDLHYTVEASGNGWHYEKMFGSFYFVGGEDRGAYFLIPSQENFFVKDKYNSVSDRENEFAFAINFIDTPTEIKAPLRYEFGVSLLPVKEHGDIQKLRRVGQFFYGEKGWDPETYRRENKVAQRHFNDPWSPRFMRPKELPVFPEKYYTTDVLPCWTLKTTQCGNPEPPEKELAEIAAHIKGINESSKAMPTLWYDAMMAPMVPNVTKYLADFERYPANRLPVEYYSTLVCPKSSWPDYYCYGLEQRLKQGVKSIYLDMTSMGVCSNRNHGCGYTDTDGRRRGSIPVLETRELFLRMQALVKGNDPEGIVILHGRLMTPNTLWVDVNTTGEEWTRAKDYSSLSPEFYQLACMNTEKVGTVGVHFAGLIYKQYPQARSGNVTQAEIMGLALLHNDTLYSVNGIEIPGNKMVWDALATFGADKPGTVWTPYWRNPANEYPDGVAVSSYERDGKLLLVIFNVAYEEKSYDLGRWSGRVIRDTLNNYAEVSAKALKMLSRGFRLLQVE